MYCYRLWMSECMSEHDKSATAKVGLKSLFAWGKQDTAKNSVNPADEVAITVPVAEDTLYWEEGNLDVTLPSLPTVDVPIIENPATVALVQSEQTQIEEKIETPTTSAASDNSFFSRMKVGLSRTRESFTSGMVTLLIGGKEIDDELLEEIETQMLVADIHSDYY